MVPYLFLVAHLLGSIGVYHEVLVNATGEVERDFDLITHLVSRDLPPNMRLAPMYPGTTHLKWIPA
jgi:hypothetical protein